MNFDNNKVSTQINHVSAIVEVLDNVLDPEFWTMMMERKSYSAHMYRNSPYESDDSCGNCDGARCDSCKEIIIPADIECSIYSDKLEQMLLDKGVPKDVAEFFAYDDSCKIYYKGYHFIFPSANMLKSKYPEKYEEIKAACIERDIKEREEIEKRFSNNA